MVVLFSPKLVLSPPPILPTSDGGVTQVASTESPVNGSVGDGGRPPRPVAVNEPLH
ncbi:hypothetical protein [Scytonema hofmannii]|uniref:hypothetical protein n=1 Tax=Scytonema hofmannii TaxID=34078 RepID=UPI00234EE186|nr:hypothetical protein [Scytonema hofmannii]